MLGNVDCDFCMIFINFTEKIFFNKINKIKEKRENIKNCQRSENRLLSKKNKTKCFIQPYLYQGGTKSLILS